MSITLILIIITVGISWYGFQNPSFLDKCLLNPVRVSAHNEYYRFVTSGFVHADFGHLIFNMFSLYFFGEAMEMFLGGIFGPNGTFYYLALYILGIVVSDVPTFIKHRKNSRYNSLGASGGVSALLFAFILLAPLQKVCLYGLFILRITENGRPGQPRCSLIRSHLRHSFYGVVISSRCTQLF